jgi:acyl-CoA thioesterase-1
MLLPYDARSRLLFIGDSITDSGRRDEREGIGSGYVRLIRDYLRASNPTVAPHVINRGNSGDTIADLSSRWEQDVIRERPDVLSIMVGINDVWHRLENAGNGGVPVSTFRQVYAHLLELTTNLLPTCKVVLCEPSVISPPAHPEGNTEILHYVEVINELAHKFHANNTVPLHSAFRSAETFRPDIDWTTDGVHPTSAGHMLIARTWLETTRSL